MDIELCKISGSYYFNLVQYNKVLNERNTLLKKYQSNDSRIIDIYDEQLSKYGSYIVKSRGEYINKLNDKGKIIHRDITSGSENICFKYISPVNDISNIKNEIREILYKSRKNDIERRTTTVGPHRDDLSIYINNIDVRSYGSQGQQRTSALTIKFASLEIIKDLTGEYPVLLLDDVLSELDEKRQKYILNSINNIQTLITGTGAQYISNYAKENISVFNVVNGIVKS